MNYKNNTNIQNNFRVFFSFKKNRFFSSSRAIIEELTALKLNQETLPLHTSMLTQLNDRNLRGKMILNHLKYEFIVNQSIYSSIYRVFCDSSITKWFGG